MTNTASNDPTEHEHLEPDPEDPVEIAKAKVHQNLNPEAAYDGDGEDSGAPASPLEFLNAQITELEAEKQELKDRMLRALADGENTRRRAMRDREEAQKYGGTRLARDLLAVYDNLERALKAADDNLHESAPDFISGVELTQRELLNAFSKHEIEKVSPEIGDKFDANIHQAMFEAPVPGAENGTIIEVMQPGFTISGRLLRAAMVGVAKNPAAGAEPSSDPQT